MHAAHTPGAGSGPQLLTGRSPHRPIPPTGLLGTFNSWQKPQLSEMPEPQSLPWCSPLPVLSCPGPLLDSELLLCPLKVLPTAATWPSPGLRGPRGHQTSRPAAARARWHASRRTQPMSGSEADIAACPARCPPEADGRSPAGKAKARPGGEAGAGPCSLQRPEAPGEPQRQAARVEEEQPVLREAMSRVSAAG